jgi:HD-like signal output (HDOD) protein
MTQTHEDVTGHLLSLIEQDRMVLPTLPEVALRIREAVNDPDISPRALSDLLSSDPAISARLIRIANSPLMRSLQKIDSLPGAVSRLGIAYSCNLATGLAMEQMFQATNEVIDERMQHVWKHSTEVAAIASVLAKHYTKLKPDQATLAALVHQIGILPVLAFAEENNLFTLEEECTDLDALIQATHPILGEKILQHWGFPENLVHVPREHVDQMRVVAQIDYADVIIVSKLLCRSAQASGLAESAWPQISSFGRLGLSPNRSIMEAEAISEEMHAAASALE